MCSISHFLLTWCKNFLSPPHCFYCDEALFTREIFCNACNQKIIPTVPYKLSITKTKHVWVHAVSLYDNPLKFLIHQKRQKNIIGSTFLAELIWERTVFRQLPCDTVVAIPLHWTRQATRGFNQAEEIARILARKKGVTCKKLLKRTRMTRYQSDLSINERKQNVKNVFSIKRGAAEQYKNKNIILVDDLMTTGNTLKYAIKELLLLKPLSIHVVVACRARC